MKETNNINCPVKYPSINTTFSLEELELLLIHLRANKTVDRTLTFPRGTIIPDGRLDLYQQGLGAIGCELVCEALFENTSIISLLLVGQAVVGNPNTPTNILFDLGAEFPDRLLANPILDLLFLEDRNFLAKIPRNTLAALFPLEQVPEYFFNWLCDRDYEDILLAAITNLKENTYKNKLINKFKHKDWKNCFNRAIAAKNPDTPVSILQQLVKDSNKSVRCYEAKNPNLPLFLRRQLAEDKQKSVRASIAKNPHTPASLHNISFSSFF